MIMTFKAASFSVPKLEERLSDLLYQDVFRADTVVVDGYDFESASREEVADLKDQLDACEAGP